MRIVGGDVHLALGARLSKNLALYGDLGVFLGATDQGLVTTHVRPAFIAAGIIGKFRLFGGVEAGVFQVRRVTSPYQMDTLSFGPTLGVSYDLAKVSRATMSLAVVGTAARIPFASDDATRHFPAVLEVALRLGIRVPG